MVAAFMLYSAYGLLKASGRVFLEASPVGVDPDEIGHALASQAGVVEIHDLHVWEITSVFCALSAHVLVKHDTDCHGARRDLEAILRARFEIEHSTLQVDHEPRTLIGIEPALGAVE